MMGRVSQPEPTMNPDLLILILLLVAPVLITTLGKVAVAWINRPPRRGRGKRAAPPRS
jgi:hypothetical protein